MPHPKFEDLPFNSRPDLSPYLIHLTKNTKSEDDHSAFDNLVNILKTGSVWGSDSSKGFIKGPNEAACFMDVPFQALKYTLTPSNANPSRPRYEPYGVVLTKAYAYKKGCRPVLYLSNKELSSLGIPPSELWRVVRLEVSGNEWISWLHEREWRCKGSLKLPTRIQAVLVKNTREARRLMDRITSDPKSFKCRPSSIIPLSVVAQGLLVP